MIRLDASARLFLHGQDPIPTLAVASIGTERKTYWHHAKRYFPVHRLTTTQWLRHIRVAVCCADLRLTNEMRDEIETAIVDPAVAKDRFSGGVSGGFVTSQSDFLRPG
jgi:hypothetical protein